MKTFFKLVSCTLVGFTLVGCFKKAVPRAPVAYRTGSYINQSVERNKDLIALEEQQIKELIAKDTVDFQQSEQGFWYRFIDKNPTDSVQRLKKGDVIRLSYSVFDLSNQIIYTEDEAIPKQYSVDQQKVFPGFREAIKLMKPNERAEFYFPSAIAYGYLGDKNKIAPNQPIRVIINTKTKE